MARRASQAEACLICMSLPCQCERPARAKPVARKASPPKKEERPVEETVTPVVQPVDRRQSMLDRMRARAAAAPSPAPISAILPPAPVRAKPTAASAELRSLPADDAMEVAAIRALQTCFDVEGQAVDRWREYLDKEPSRAERAAAWRMNNRP